jgi:sugar/nucleoside kinase (ribokinase family)
MPPNFPGRVCIYGPAYLDRTWRVEGSLSPPHHSPADHSLTLAQALTCTNPDLALEVRSPAGDSLRVRGNGPRRSLTTVEPHMFGPEDGPAHSTVTLQERTDALGGMGPGYALALGGHLVTPLGRGEDAAAIRRMLRGPALQCTVVPVSGSGVDTTDLILNAAGEKLAIGQRAASAHVTATRLLEARRPGEVTVLCSLPSPVCHDLLQVVDGFSVLAPSLRYVSEPDFRRALARAHLVCLNEREWRTAGRPTEHIRDGGIALVTRGADGASVFWRTSIELRELRTSAPPPARIGDANRAGETYAAAFMGGLAARGVICGGAPLTPGLLADAAREAARAAHLQLGLTGLTFPTRDQVLESPVPPVSCAWM